MIFELFDRSVKLLDVDTVRFFEAISILDLFWRWQLRSCTLEIDLLEVEFIFVKLLLKLVQRRVFYQPFVFHLDHLSRSPSLLKETIISNRVHVVGNNPEMMDCRLPSELFVHWSIHAITPWRRGNF
jgi:hypothetical protein